MFRNLAFAVLTASLLLGCASPKYVQLKHEPVSGEKVGKETVIYLKVTDRRVAKNRVGSQGRVRPDKAGDWVVLTDSQTLENFVADSIRGNLIAMGFDARYLSERAEGTQGAVMEVSINKFWVVKYEEFAVAHMNSEIDLTVSLKHSGSREELDYFDVSNGDFVAEHPFQDDEEAYEESLDKTFDGLMVKFREKVASPAFMSSVSR